MRFRKHYFLISSIIIAVLFIQGSTYGMTLSLSELLNSLIQENPITSVASAETANVYIRARSSTSGLLPYEANYYGQDGYLSARYLFSSAETGNLIDMVHYYDHALWTGRKILYQVNEDDWKNVTFSNQTESVSLGDLSIDSALEWQQADPDIPVYSFWMDMGNRIICTTRQIAFYHEKRPVFVICFDEQGCPDNILYGSSLENELLPHVEETIKDGNKVVASTYYYQTGEDVSPIELVSTKTYNSDGLLTEMSYDHPVSFFSEPAFLCRTFDYNEKGTVIHEHLKTDYSEYDISFNSAGQMNILNDMNNNLYFLYSYNEDGTPRDMLCDPSVIWPEQSDSMSPEEVLLELSETYLYHKEVTLLHVDWEKGLYTTKNAQIELDMSLSSALEKNDIRHMIPVYENNICTKKTITANIFDDYGTITGTETEIQYFDSSGQITDSETMSDGLSITFTEDSQNTCRVYEQNSFVKAVIKKTAPQSEAVFTMDPYAAIPSVLYDAVNYIKALSY